MTEIRGCEEEGGMGLKKGACVSGRDGGGGGKRGYSGLQVQISAWTVNHSTSELIAIKVDKIFKQLSRTGSSLCAGYKVKQ